MNLIEALAVGVGPVRCRERNAIADACGSGSVTGGDVENRRRAPFYG
jgi:hypothetical protein